VTSHPRSLAAELWTAHRHRLEPEIPIALLDEEDEQDVAYWQSLQQAN